MPQRSHLKGKGAGVLISRIPQDEAAPSGLNSEHFQPEQPAKTLEKAPPGKKGRHLQARHVPRSGMAGKICQALR